MLHVAYDEKYDDGDEKYDDLSVGEREELERLRHENCALREDIHVLKEAIGFFAASGRGRVP